MDAPDKFKFPLNCLNQQLLKRNTLLLIKFGPLSAIIVNHWSYGPIRRKNCWSHCCSE